jgi:prepilin-type N-terminal cleavage/methylation domain-containing protein
MKHDLARRRRARKRNRKHLSGMTLIEVMIVMVIMALVAVAAGFAVMPTLQRARVRQAATDASSIRQMVLAYQIEFGECPSIQDLIDKQILSASTATADPWGTPFSIACDDAEPAVISAGPDKPLSTEDDIS